MIGAPDLPPDGAGHEGEVPGPPGGPQKVFGYCGGARVVLESNVNVATLKPLLDMAVPYMMEGVRP